MLLELSTHNNTKRTMFTYVTPCLSKSLNQFKFVSNFPISSLSLSLSKRSLRYEDLRLTQYNNYLFCFLSEQNNSNKSFNNES